MRHFVSVHAERFAQPGGPPGVHPALMRVLERADWPGNVRQLDGVVQRLLVDSDGAPIIGLEHVADEIRELLEPTIRPAQRESSEPLRLGRETKAAAARRLGISRTTLYRRLARERRDCDGDGSSSHSELQRTPDDGPMVDGRVASDTT